MKLTFPDISFYSLLTMLGFLEISVTILAIHIITSENNETRA